MEQGSEIDLYERVKKMIVRAVKLKIPPDKIENDVALFGGGIGLDSIDALELVIALEKEFGVRIPDSSVGKKVLVSVETIVSYIKENTGGKPA